MAEEKQSRESSTITPKKKIDLKSALAVIPPASQLYREEKKLRERRIRLRFRNELKEGIAKVNPVLAKELEITEKVEVVVAGRRRLIYNVDLDDEVPVSEIWVNGEKLPELGIADNTIVTVRAYRRKFSS